MPRESSLIATPLARLLVHYDNVREVRAIDHDTVDCERRDRGGEWRAWRVERLPGSIRTYWRERPA